MMQKIEDIKQKLIMKTGECLDLYKQKHTVNNLAEEFDENIETYYPDKWLNISKINMTGVEIFDNIIEEIETLLEDIEELYDQIEQECKQLWYDVLVNDTSDLKKEYIANIENYNNEQIEKAIDKVLDELSIEDCEYNVEESTEKFANKLKEYLS